MELVSIEAPNPATIVVRGPASLAKWREKYCVWVDGAQFSPLFKRKDRNGNRLWDGKWRVGEYLRSAPGGYMWRGGRGFLSKVLAEYKAASFQLPDTPRLRFDDELPPDKVPHDYQWEALDLIAKKHWGRIALATNAGKGGIIALAARAAAKRGHRVLILCDEVAVLEALTNEIPDWIGIRPAQVTQGVKTPPDALITIAMVPTLYRRVLPPTVEQRIVQLETELPNLQPGTPGQAAVLTELHDLRARLGKGKKNAKKLADPTPENLEWIKWLESIGMALLDEADKATADSWGTVLSGLINTLWRVGFSGTFDEKVSVSDYTLEESLGPILIRVKNIELVTRGISAKPEVQLYRYEPRLPVISAADWKAMLGPERRNFIFDECVRFNAERHAFISSLLLKDDLNAVIVNRVEHGRQLAAVLPNCIFLSGDDDLAVRDHVLTQFANGTYQNLITTKILDRGSNRLGVTVGLIFASGEGSVRQTLQRIGRGLRRSGGKEFLFLRDVMDIGHSYLESAAKARLAIYNKEKFDIRIIQKKRDLAATS